MLVVLGRRKHDSTHNANMTISSTLALKLDTAYRTDDYGGERALWKVGYNILCLGL